MTTESPNLPKLTGDISIPAAILIVFAALAVVGVGIYYLDSTGRGLPDYKAPKVTATTGQSTALVECRNAVRSDLKNPRSANFKGILDSPLNDVTSLGSRRFRITSWVEAQNGFGATIRRTFSCTVNMASRNIENLLII